MRAASTISYSAFSTSFISQSIKGEIRPEDELPSWLYLTICFVYLIIVSCAAIFINDLTLIFGIIAGLAECTTVFILPAVFYLIACRMEDKRYEGKEKAQSLMKKPRKKKGGGLFTRIGVSLYMGLGLAYFCVSNYFLLTKIFRR